MAVKQFGYGDYYCTCCGARVEKTASVCPQCGKPYGNEKYVGQMQVGAGGVGYSVQATDGAFKKYRKKTKRIAFVFLLLISLAIGTFLYFSQHMEASYIAAVIGIIWLIDLIWFIASSADKKDWEGTVESKKTSLRGGGRNRMRTQYRVYVRTTDGKRKVIKTMDDSRWFDVLNEGDRVRFLGKIRYYEKYDKSRDPFVVCAGCGMQRDARDTYCGRCGCVMLKGAPVAYGAAPYGQNLSAPPYAPYPQSPQYQRYQPVPQQGYPQQNYPQQPQAPYQQPVQQPAYPQSTPRAPKISAKPQVRVLGIPVSGKIGLVIIGIVVLVLIAANIVSGKFGNKNTVQPTDRPAVTQQTETTAPSSGKKKADTAESTTKKKSKSKETTTKKSKTKETTTKKNKSKEITTQKKDTSTTSIDLSDVGNPHLKDFSWYTEKTKDAVPKDAKALKKGKSVSGMWKAYYLYPDNSQELANIEILAGDRAVTVNIIPYKICYDGKWEKENAESYSYDGALDAGEITAYGEYGSIEFHHFYQKNGKQYAFGTVELQYGGRGTIVLVRP